MSDERLAAEREGGAIPFRLTERSIDNAEDIARIRDMGFAVDDDNDPLPENVPQNTNVTNQGDNVTTEGENSLLSIHHQQWKEDLFVDKAAGSRGLRPSVRNADVMKNLSTMEVFLMFFGDGVLNLVLDSTNQNLPQGTVKVTKGELCRFLGMQFAIATTSGFTRDDF